MNSNYGIGIWGDDNFFIDGDEVRVNYASQPSLMEITQKIRAQNHSGPIILRFPHLIKKQIDSLYNAFDNAKSEFGYEGKFHALFPLKVNQFPSFVKQLMSVSSRHNYGLEAGSKAELILAMHQAPISSPITVNGFKDKEMISLIFIAAASGHNITVVIEGLTELETILEVYKEFNTSSSKQVCPSIGMRVRLHSTGVGGWAKSGGYESKFGLTSTELLIARKELSRHELLDNFTMIHFHIGSQMGEIKPLKKALREAGNIYASLKQKGANSLNAINIGGGLAIEYSQHISSKDLNYSLHEFANDVVFMMQEIAKNKGVQEPDIYTESGRFVAATHSVLIAPVLELFSQEYHKDALEPKEVNPPLVQELYDLYEHIDKTNAKEYLHDALDHKESLLTLFDLGYIDLDDRSNTEILVNLIIKKYISLLKTNNVSESTIQESKIVDKYLVNFSIFQSLPDFWGIGQKFPLMPISHLSTTPRVPASIWDITCDSDGEVPFDSKKPLYLHDVDIEKEEYFLAFFLTGAYQDTLGMKHNLFEQATQATIQFTDNDYEITDIINSKNLSDIIATVGYDSVQVSDNLESQIELCACMTDAQKKQILDKLHLYMGENGYLKTIQAIQNK